MFQTIGSTEMDFNLMPEVKEKKYMYVYLIYVYKCTYVPMYMVYTYEHLFISIHR